MQRAGPRQSGRLGQVRRTRLSDRGPVRVAAPDAALRLQLDRRFGVGAVVRAGEVVPQPGGELVPGLVGQADRAGHLGGGVIAVGEQQPLRPGQPGEEVRVLRGREDRVLEGVGEEHGRLVGVDLVDHGRGRPHAARAASASAIAPSKSPVTNLRLQRRHLRTGPPGDVAQGKQPGDGLERDGLVGIERADQVGPAAHRADRLDPWVLRAREQRRTGAVRDPDRGDPAGVGRGVLVGPVDHLADVGNGRRAGDVDAAAGVPEATTRVRDDLEPGRGQLRRPGRRTRRSARPSSTASPRAGTARRPGRSASVRRRRARSRRRRGCAGTTY